MRGMLVALIAAALASGGTPKQQPKPTTTHKAETAQQPATLNEQSASGSSERSGCPKTSDPRASCDAVTARATERQANLMADSNWLSLFTILVAGIAAIFAWRAARAGTKSYEAFVAAEDAHLVLDFPGVRVVQHYFPEYGDAEWRNHYVVTAKITNVGRSTALIRGVRLDGKIIGSSQSLRRDEDWRLEDKITRETLAPFDIVINYSSPITDTGRLTVKGQVFNLGKLAWGVVVSTKLKKGKGWRETVLAIPSGLATVINRLRTAPDWIGKSRQP